MDYRTKVILLVDIDCFYCQVEEKLNPNLKGKPAAVVQFNTWREGGIIAANYLAREKGVTKGLWCYEAKEKCPDILFATVNEVRGRADLTKYREAGKEVFDVLQKYTAILEKASVDEAYLDITEAVNKRLQDDFDHAELTKKMCRTHVVGYSIEDYLYNFSNDSEFSEGNLKLIMGALISEEIRAEISDKTGYKCSVGIAHNKMLAKLACGLNKPNAQTVFPQESVPSLFNKLPVQKIKGLGGKFGKSIAEELDISHVSQLMEFSEKELVKKFEEKSGKWLYNVARGIDLDPVKIQVISKSIGCCKRFPGKNCLVSLESIERWINELATEVSERLERDMDENNRKAKQLIFSLTQTIDGKDISSSKTRPLSSYEQSKIAREFSMIVNKSCRKPNGNYNNIVFLGLSAVNFQEIKNNTDIKSFLKKMDDHRDKPSSTRNVKNKNTFPPELHDDTSITQFSGKREIKDSVDDRVNSNSNENSDVSSLRVQETYSKQIIPVDNNECRPSSSFFDKYFKSTTNCELESGEYNDKRTNYQDSGECNNDLESKNVLGIRICPECHENIVVSDFNLHMDQHCASKEKNIPSLQCNQSVNSKNCGNCSTCSKIQQENTNNDRNNREIVAPNQKKRKVNDTPSVLTLFKKFEELNEDNSNYCQECNKRIKLEDVLNHDDYHTALQIHLQLNSNSTQSSLSKAKPISSRKGKDNKKQDLGNILNFFKHT